MSLKITFITKEENREVVPEPQLASSSFPEWFSSLERPSKSKCPFSFLHKDQNHYDLIAQTPNNNVKNCPGIIDYLTTGYIIPSWDNFMFREENQNLFVNWSGYYENNFASHGISQFNTMNKNQVPLYKNFFKLVSPWIIRTQPGVSCLITHPYWHRKTNFTTVSGIYNTDSQELALNWFFEWNYKISSGMELDGADMYNQTISMGDPLMLIIPFYRKSYKKEVKYVSSAECTRIRNKVTGVANPFRYNDRYRQFRKNLIKFFT